MNGTLKKTLLTFIRFNVDFWFWTAFFKFLLTAFREKTWSSVVTKFELWIRNDTRANKISSMFKEQCIFIDTWWPFAYGTFFISSEFWEPTDHSKQFSDDIKQTVFFVCVHLKAWQRCVKYEEPPKKSLNRHYQFNWTWTVIINRVLGDLVTFYFELYWIIKIEHFSIAIIFIHGIYYSSPLIAGMEYDDNRSCCWRTWEREKNISRNILGKLLFKV